jgi:glycolate oxidase FAD binding subunit
MARRAIGPLERGAERDRRVTTSVSQSAEAVGERVRDARNRGARLRIVGGATWLDAGRPVDSSERLSLAEQTGIVEYTPGDLTLTALAGTTLREIHDAVAGHGQWLALDPFGSNDGTIGATIATASAGPLATRFGAPRDLTLGLEFVTGRGAIVRGGGRVVKNVAGFDLTRLLTGSWGTLGVITEITIRLHARPESDVTLAVAAQPTSEEVTRVRATLERWPFVPFACELVNETLGRRIGVGGAATLIRLGGNSDAVSAQRLAVSAIGPAAEVDPDVWRLLRDADGESSIVLRLSRAPADVGATWSDAFALTALYDDARVSASPKRGIVRCVIPADAASTHQFASALADVGSRVIAERAPAHLWNVPPLSRAADPVQSRVRDAFDPQRILNRGILGAES